MKNIVIAAFFDELQKLAADPMTTLGGQRMNVPSSIGGPQQMPKPSNTFGQNNPNSAIQQNSTSGTFTANQGTQAQANSIPRTSPSDMASRPMQRPGQPQTFGSMATTPRSSATLYNASPAINFTM